MDISKTRLACRIEGCSDRGEDPVRFVPQFDQGNGWYNILPTPPPSRELTDEEVVDWLVIGAGFTGLSAARRLADCLPDDRIALVEADRVGRGTSGRNAGFAIDLPFIREAHGSIEHGRRLLKMHRAGVNELNRLVEEHAIDCQWKNSGKYMVAVGRQACADLMETQAFLEKIGEPSEVLDRNELNRRLGTRFYRAGLRSSGTYLMNPAALTRGLAASLPENVALYEDSPITSIRFGAQIVAHTAKGAIKAPRVILATNGFTEAFGIMKNRVFNIMSFASITSALSSKAGEAEGGLGCIREWGVHPVGPAGATIRRTRDNRFWYRSGLIYSPLMRSSRGLLERYLRHHIKEFKARFPQLGEPRFEHTYGGGMCLSQNAEPVFQRPASNVFVAACQNGTGVAKGTIHGRLIADWAASVDSELLDIARTYGEPSRLPVEPFLGWGVAIRLAWDGWRGWME